MSLNQSIGPQQGDMMPVLQKRLCSPSWEIRDSALEFFTLAVKYLKRQEWFWHALCASEVLALARGLLDDPESYVRASAVKAWGQFSMAASPGLKMPGLDHNGSYNEASITARLLEILSADSEGFPRRAAVGVFVDWLREGHSAVLGDTERFVSEVLQAVERDLDWEVKLIGLDLAGVFIAQSFDRSGLAECPYAPGVPSAGQPARLPELLQVFCRVQLFRFLFGALEDCDRPVALKACKVLADLKRKICAGRGLEVGQGLDPPDRAGLEETSRTAAHGASRTPAGDSPKMASQDPKHVLLLLESVDLEGLREALGRSSDYLEKSPWSLLQDILSAGGALEDNGVDCY